jgi:hypothetical protein
VAAAIVPGSPVQEVVKRIVGAGAETPAPDSIPLGEWGQQAGVALVPSEELEIAFETLQREGAIELVEVGTNAARIEVRSDTVGFVVGDRSILVENRGAAASYRISLPADLPLVSIRVGQRTVYRKIGAELLRDEFEPRGDTRRLDFTRIPAGD